MNDIKTEYTYALRDMIDEIANKYAELFDEYYEVIPHDYIDPFIMSTIKKVTRAAQDRLYELQEADSDD